MRCLPEVFNEKWSVWASYLCTDETYDSESGKANKNGRMYGSLHVIEFRFLECQ